MIYDRRAFLKTSLAASTVPTADRQATAQPAAFSPGFETRKIQTSGATIDMLRGGSGPALLLLHGYPQTHVEWHKIGPQLAERFTVVLTDLRGYGDSSKPADGENHANYSKRAMALDQIEVMQTLGYDRFAVVGHDRGARVAWRLAVEHPEREDGERRVMCPLLVLWGERGTVGRLYDVMRIWRDHAVNVTGKALPAGHFLPEEVPDETLSALISFLQG